MKNKFIVGDRVLISIQDFANPIRRQPAIVTNVGFNLYVVDMLSVIPGWSKKQSIWISLKTMSIERDKKYYREKRIKKLLNGKVERG